MENELGNTLLEKLKQVLASLFEENDGKNSREVGIYALSTLETIGPFGI